MASKLNVQQIESPTGTIKLSGNATLDTSSSTGFLNIPAGTSDQRGTPEEGAIRWNYDYNSLEVYTGSKWELLNKPVDTDNIVKAGLILNLDAGNKNSYPEFGTTWYDLSGRNNNGTLVNGVGYNSGNLGSLVFDGVNDGVQLSGTNLSLNQMTISSWNYSTNYQQNGFMFEKTTNGSVNTQYSLFYNSGNNSIYYRTYGLSTLDFITNTTTAGVVNNQWNNVVATWDGTNKRIYVNGILRATSANLTGTVTQNTTGAAYIGIYGNFAGYPFNGRIAQTQIYNRALTASEIQQNYNATRSRFGI
jgi:hypothetical protein